MSILGLKAVSTFTANLAVGDPCCVNPLGTSGGAIHVEDLTSLRISSSLFLGNRADSGGGISTYRGDVEVRDSVFQANQRNATAGKTPHNSSQADAISFIGGRRRVP